MANILIIKESSLNLDNLIEFQQKAEAKTLLVIFIFYKFKSTSFHRLREITKEKLRFQVYLFFLSVEKVNLIFKF